MLGSPEGLARNDAQGMSAGMAVEDVQMDESRTAHLQRIRERRHSRLARPLRGFKRVDETLGVLATGVDGLQESIVRCRNETNGVKTMFPKEAYRGDHDMIEKALDSLRVRVKDLEVRTTLKSDDISSAQRGVSDERTKIQLRKEIAEASSAVKTIAQKLADDHEGMSKGLAESNAGVEKLRGAMRKIVEIINSERQEHRETAKIVGRNEKAAVETEISINRKFEKISGEIVELRRDLVEGITQTKLTSGAKGSDGDEKLGSGRGGGGLVLYRKLGNLESRLRASESAGSRQDATIRGHISELRGEMGELRALCKALREIW